MPNELKSSDLQYSYPLASGLRDNPFLTGHPDRDLLNRGQRHEILYFINQLWNVNPQWTKLDALKVEHMIQKGLPGSIRQRQAIRNWIAVEWQSYDYIGNRRGLITSFGL